MATLRINGQPYEVASQALLDDLRRRGVLVRPDVLQPWSSKEIATTEGTRGRERVLIFESFHSGFGNTEIEYQEVGDLIYAAPKYEYSDGVDARFKGYLLPGPLVTTITLTGNTVNCDQIAEASESETAPTAATTYVYAGGGTRMYKLDTNDTLGVLRIHVAAMAGRFKWEQQLVVALGTANVVSVLTTVAAGAGVADTWTAALDADIVARALGQLGPNLYLANAVNTVIAVNVDQTITAVSVTTTSAFNIGDSSNLINSILGYDRLLILGTSVGLWVLDQSTQGHHVTPKLLSLWSAENGREIREWDSSVWATSVLDAIEYVPARDRLMPLEDFLNNRSPAQGRATAIESHGNWIYFAVYNETDTYIVAARRPVEGEFGRRLVGHPIVRLASTEVRTMRVASRIAANQRLYFGNGVNVSYLIMPRGEQFPTRDANYRYRIAATMLFYMGTFKGNPSTYKALRSVELHFVRDAGATRYFEPFYLVDRGAQTAFNQQGTNNRVNATGWQEKTVVDSTGAALQAMGRQFELRLGVTSDSTTDPPELELPMLFRFTEFPDHTAQYTVLLVLPELDEWGGSKRSRLADLRALLRTSASTDTAIVLLESEDDPSIGVAGGPTGQVGLNIIITELEEITTVVDGKDLTLVLATMRVWET